MPSPHHLIIHGVTSHFDQEEPVNYFPECYLDTFMYAQGHRDDFESRDRHIETLVAGLGLRLRKLVLLRCSPADQQRAHRMFIEFPDPGLLCGLGCYSERDAEQFWAGSSVDSIRPQNSDDALYSVPLINEERELCKTLETGIMRRRRPPVAIYICMDNEVINGGG